MVVQGKMCQERDEDIGQECAEEDGHLEYGLGKGILGSSSLSRKFLSRALKQQPAK
jgi:hypothetical protein